MNIFTVFLIQPLANGLVLFYKLLGQNLGLAIIGFSLFLRVVFSPLTKSSMKSMKKMKEFEPQLAKLKKRHKGDRKKLMQAQAEFYKQKGINPGAGCLPQLLQLVVLIALFQVFLRALSSDGDTVSKFNELLYQPLRFSQGAVINTKFLYLDIAKPDLLKLPFLAFAIPGPVLITAAISQFISAKIMTPYIETEKKIAKKTKGEADDFQVAMQKSMIYTMPFFTLIIGMRFPSGLAIYWVVFSLYQTVQQYRMAGWGGMTPWIKKLGLLKLPGSNGKERKK